jgi:hypothetical protein
MHFISMSSTAFELAWLIVDFKISSELWNKIFISPKPLCIQNSLFVSYLSKKKKTAYLFLGC